MSSIKKVRINLVNFFDRIARPCLLHPHPTHTLHSTRQLTQECAKMSGELRAAEETVEKLKSRLRSGKADS